MTPKTARLLALLLALLLFTAPTASVAANGSLDTLLDSLTPKGASLSAQVVRLGDGAVLFSRNAQQQLTPASVAKLFPTATALALYGPEHRFLTEALAQPQQLANGSLAGPLYLRGGGDPFLDLPGLDLLADCLKAQGLKRIEGPLVADASLFRGSPFGPDWDPADLEKPYAAPASALNLCENAVSIVLSPTTPGRPPAISIEPDPGHLAIENRAVTSSRSHSPRLARVGQEDRFVLTGPVRQSAAFRVPLRNPALFAAGVFKHRLQSRGIQVLGPVRTGSAPPDAKALVGVPSAPLADIVAHVNKNSVNFAAETLLRLCGAPLRGPDTGLDGLRVVHHFAAFVGAIPVTLADGSGLSRSSKTSAAAITALLTYAYEQPWGPAFYRSLAIAGQDGTLASRLRDPPANGRILAKTGTLTGVSALAGYVCGDDGPLLAFALLLNNGSSGAAGHDAADLFAAALVPLATPPAP